MVHLPRRRPTAVLLPRGDRPDARPLGTAGQAIRLLRQAARGIRIVLGMRRGGVSAAGGAGPGLIVPLVGLAGQAEGPLPDHVPVDLAGSAADAALELRHHLKLPE